MEKILSGLNNMNKDVGKKTYTGYCVQVSIQKEERKKTRHVVDKMIAKISLHLR